jgi:hypothetical protein
MSKGKIIKTVLISTAVCSGLWQAAKFIDVLSSAKGQRSISGLIPSPGKQGLSVLPPGVADALKSNPSMLNQLVPGTAPAPAKPKEMVIFSANGTPLTPAEMETLRREAERNRPKAPAPAPPKSRN